MEIISNNYSNEIINIIIGRIKISTPGVRRWRNSEKFSGGYDYGETVRSTFPWYIKFAYVKRPKNWYTLTEDEKLSQEQYYQYNTKDILRILNKILNNKRLTELQGKFARELFINFRQEELDFFYEHNEFLINLPDMKDCPF